jgi:hypothetical protein
MARKAITIDPDRIADKLAFHEREAKRLRLLLESFDALKEFSEEPKHKPLAKTGRPRKDSPILPVLRDYIRAHRGEFSTADLWEQIKDRPGVERSSLMPIIREFLSDGVIEEKQKAYGRRIGKYVASATAA